MAWRSASAAIRGSGGCCCWHAAASTATAIDIMMYLLFIGALRFEGSELTTRLDAHIQAGASYPARCV